MQRTRVHAAELADAAVGAQRNLIGTIDEANAVNVHGLQIEISVEVEDAAANAQGLWAVWCIPDEASAVPALNFGALETEASNAFLWAVGTWEASNETSWGLPPTFIKTTRNCQAGARIVISVTPTGVTAGQVSINALMRYFTTAL